MNTKKIAQIDEVIVIDNNSAFNEWKNDLRKFRPGSSSKTYNFDLPKLSPTENQNISKLVNGYNKECGCNSGSFFMSFIFTITVAAYFISGGKFSAIGFQQLGLLAGITFFAAITGKLFGLQRARWRLIKLSDNLSEKLYNGYAKQSIITNH